MSKMVFVPAPNSHLTDAQAKSVGKELSRIEKNNGAVTPLAVVDAARNESSTLHPFFEWDDGVAAESYRLEQARSLVRSVCLVHAAPKKNDNEHKPIRAFVSVMAHESETKFEGRAYLSIAVASGDSDYRQQVLDDAMDELRSWKRRYETFRDFFSGVIKEIDKLEIEPQETKR